MHEIIISHNNQFSPSPYVGYIQLRAFTSFFNDMVKWKLGQRILEVNQMEKQLRIREEPSPFEKLVPTHYGFLDSLDREANEESIQNEVLDLCTKHIHGQMKEYLQGSEMRWIHSN